MNCVFIEDIENFKKISKEWDTSLGLAGEDNPFLLSDYISIWWKHYSRNRKLLIYTISDGGNIIAGLPLCMEKRIARDAVVHIGAQTANLTQFFQIDKNLNFAEKVAGSLNGRRDWDIFLLERVLSSFLPAGNFKKIVWEKYAGVEYIESDAGFDGIIDLKDGYEHIFKNLNNRLRRYISKGRQDASLLGEFRLLRIEGESGVKRLFKDYTDMSIRSFRMRGGVSAFEDKVYVKFFEELLTVFETKSLLDAHRLVAGEDTLGISFGYRFGNGFKWILTAYNSEFQDLRPGHLLLDSLVSDAVKNGDRYFDMYYGGELFYKKQWCNKMIPLRRMEIRRKNFANRLIGFADNRIRSNKTLLKTARNLRNLLNRAR